MDEIDISRIKASPESKVGKTGEKNSIIITGAPLSALAEGLSGIVESPTQLQPDMMYNYDLVNGVATVEAYFVSLEAGDYKATVKFNDKIINGSPFAFKVTGEKVSAEKFISKVKVRGRAYELGKSGEINEFYVDCRSVQPPIGGLKVHVKGPKRCFAAVDIHDNRNGTYNVIYKPISPGEYTMDIKIAGADIPGSPFKIRVSEFVSN